MISEETVKAMLEDVRNGMPVGMVAKTHGVSSTFLYWKRREARLDTSRSTSHKNSYKWYMENDPEKYSDMVASRRKPKSEETKRRMSESRMRTMNSEMVREKYGMSRKHPNMQLPKSYEHELMVRRKQYMKYRYGYKYERNDSSATITYDGNTVRSERLERDAFEKYGIRVVDPNAADSSVKKEKIIVVPSWEDKQGGFNVD